MLSNEKVTVARYIAKFLAEKNCSLVSQVSGGMIAFLTDAIHQLNSTDLIHNRHEQGSGFTAEGAARVSGKPAVAMATSGPGATNLITPIASCFFDSIPSIFLTGQVRTNELRTNPKQRQNGFQELDVANLVKDITKHVWKITDATQVPSVLEEAWSLCQQGRPGPVLIDIPIDIQQEEIIFLESNSEGVQQKGFKPTKNQQNELEQAIALLQNASNPMALIGGGVRTALAVEKLERFLLNVNLPFVTSLMGLDSVDHNSRNYLGFIGSYGNRWANEALSNADVLLVLGSRLDVRQTGPDVFKFKNDKKIIRIDIDENELSGRVSSDISIEIDLIDALEYLTPRLGKVVESKIVEETVLSRERAPQINEQEMEFDLNPNEVMEELSKYFRLSKGYVVDVGQHQMWAAQSIKLESHQRFLTSGGLGSMGFAIPATIGAAIAEPGHWVTIVGDGCIQLSIQELQTISHYKLPISVIVINNNQHGMVAQFQEENMDGRYIGTRDGYSNPNFSLISEAFGFDEYVLINSKDELLRYTSRAYEMPLGPVLIEIRINEKAKALPKMQSKSPKMNLD